MRRAPVTPSPRSRPWSLLPVTVAAAVLGLLAVGTLPLGLTATAATAGTTAVSLIDDDGGAALFAPVALTPGRVQTACVGLTASGSVDPGTEVAPGPRTARPR